MSNELIENSNDDARMHKLCTTKQNSEKTKKVVTWREDVKRQ